MSFEVCSLMHWLVGGEYVRTIVRGLILCGHFCGDFGVCSVELEMDTGIFMIWIVEWI